MTAGDLDARGPGAEIHLYDTDPDEAAATAERLGLKVLQAPTDKPHGLRETYFICPNGYVWIASRILSMAERQAVTES